MATTDFLFLDGTRATDGTACITARSLAAVFVLECCQNLDVDVTFVSDTKTPPNVLDEKMYIIPIENRSFSLSFRQLAHCPKMIQNCTFPAVLVPENSWCVVGLSASLRHILKRRNRHGASTLAKMLLGFREGCLQACAEVSVWTKFCEIEILETLCEAYANACINESQEINFPRNILRFERHLEHPPIMHNALKHKQKIIKESLSDKALVSELMQLKVNELPSLDHHYAEGLHLTFADLLLYVSIYLVIHRFISVIDFGAYVPLTLKWHETVKEKSFVKKAQPLLDKALQNSPPTLLKQLPVILPQVLNESLYKSDPNRYKPCWRAFTNQKDIDKVLKKFDDFSFEMKQINFEFPELKSNVENIFNGMSYMHLDSPSRINIHKVSIKNGIDWSMLPSSINLEGQVPASRFERKSQQLENMVLAVMSISKEGDRIIDFCSGSGHLGLLLAYFLPKCKVMLAENKSNSLGRALERITTSGLSNVEFYQCNLDYFDGEFDIGVCLHACGVATDLVMQKCVKKRAAFVCCPCCYGGVQANHILQYPRSELFKKEFSICLEDYLILSHAADQTHDSENHKTQQGIKCMRYVDFDRLTYAQESSYEILLALMNPPSCSPKNHILIGKPLDLCSFSPLVVG